jgi:short-subunit dehydrogenase
MKKNRVALITGANGYLGKYLSKILWEKNFSIILMSRNFDKNFKNYFKPTKKNKVYFYKCDLANFKSLEKVLKKIKKKNKSLDVVINNAAVQKPIGNLENLNFEDIKKNFNINYFAPIKIIKDTIPLLKKKKFSSIINLSGGGATSNRDQFAIYGSSKTALARSSEIISKEIKKYKININSLSPGPLPSKMLNEIIRTKKINFAEKMKAKKVLNKIINLNPIKLLIYYLISKEGNKISGKIISSKWDNWKNWKNNLQKINNLNLYTLRRLTARDRGFKWGDNYE